MTPGITLKIGLGSNYLENIELLTSSCEKPNCKKFAALSSN
jgi:hypothetical protein